MSRLPRVAALALAVGLILALAPAHARPLEDLIVGDWTLNGGVVHVVRSSGDAPRATAAAAPAERFFGVIVKDLVFETCTHPVGEVMWGITKTAAGYTGWHQTFGGQDFKPGYCLAGKPSERDPATWTITAKGGRLVLHACTESNCKDLTRAAPPGTVPPASGVSLLAQGDPGAAVTAGTGSAVGLTALATLRSGDRLLIAAQRGGESKARSVAVCSRSPCTGTWREKSAMAVRFQAAIVRGTGSAAKAVSTSRTVTVSWKPPPAQPGHYTGKSSQGEMFALDVAADGMSVVNVQTGPINASCTGGNAGEGRLDLPGPFPISADRSFSISVANEGATAEKGESLTRSISIAGRFSGTTATGTFLVQYTNWASRGTCTSGKQTWIVNRVG